MRELSPELIRFERLQTVPEPRELRSDHELPLLFESDFKKSCVWCVDGKEEENQSQPMQCVDARLLTAGTRDDCPAPNHRKIQGNVRKTEDCPASHHRKRTSFGKHVPAGKLCLAEEGGVVHVKVDVRVEEPGPNFKQMRLARYRPDRVHNRRHIGTSLPSLNQAPHAVPQGTKFRHWAI